MAWVFNPRTLQMEWRDDNTMDLFKGPGAIVQAPVVDPNSPYLSGAPYPYPGAGGGNTGAGGIRGSIAAAYDRSPAASPFPGGGDYGGGISPYAVDYGGNGPPQADGGAVGGGITGTGESYRPPDLNAPAGPPRADGGGSAPADISAPSGSPAANPPGISGPGVAGTAPVFPPNPVGGTYNVPGGIGTNLGPGTTVSGGDTSPPAAPGATAAPGAGAIGPPSGYDWYTSDPSALATWLAANPNYDPNSAVGRGYMNLNPSEAAMEAVYRQYGPLDRLSTSFRNYLVNQVVPGLAVNQQIRAALPAAAAGSLAGPDANSYQAMADAISGGQAFSPGGTASALSSLLSSQDPAVRRYLDANPVQAYNWGLATMNPASPLYDYMRGAAARSQLLGAQAGGDYTAYLRRLFGLGG